MIRLVVFDMAGTTVNEDNVVYKTLQRTINEKGFAFSLDQVLAEGAGKEKSEAIKSILKAFAHNEDNDLASDIYKQFIVRLADAYNRIQVQPQVGAVELFGILKRRNIRVVLNTGYDEETALKLIERLNWKKGTDFDGLVTASDVKRSRPDPDMIWRAMELFGIRNAGEVVKVGDSIIDIEEGRNAGCALNIGITTGAHTFEQLQSANPDYIITSLLELITILDEMKNA